MRAGKLEDPYRDLNEFKSRWIGNTDWEYRTTFNADAKLFDHERIDLVCDGLDTVATITLNGQQVAQTANMHRGYRFDVRPQLKRDRNELAITFASPVKYAYAMREKLGFRPYCNGPGGPFNFIRKMACNFGWDWGPALPTCGIWRGIRLEGWSGVRIAAVRPSVIQASEKEAVINVDVEFERAPSRRFADYQVNLRNRGDIVAGTDEPTSDLSDQVQLWVEEPSLWWPRGHGHQHLYDLEVTDGEQTWTGRIGLRTVELDTAPDDIGRKFVVKVNAKPIFCKGFNWIPDDCFLDRACEPGRVRQRIQQAVDAGGNMLRVWGGGIFETDDFYSICDEMGVLVWQDFLFACAMYPEEQPYFDEVEAEARYNVARLAHHPSLAVWNGCNENIWAYRDWGWKDDPSLKDKKLTWGKNFYFELLPKVCKELTPGVPYWAGSPWSGDYDVDNGVPPNAATHGNKHVWEAWFKQDYSVYRTFEPRFCSEFGFQGPAPYASIAAVVPPEARDFGSVEMRHRQKAGDRVRDDGDRRNLRHLIRHFNLPGAQELLDALEPPEKDRKVPECGCEPLHPARPSRALQGPDFFDDLHYLLQINQCRALTLGVEWFRSRQPTCMGTLYWQLNDCWPGATSWSCIDGNGRFKPLWYATRKFFADVLATIQPASDGSLQLCVINDTDARLSPSYRIARRSFGGETIGEQIIEADIAPRSVQRVTLASHVATPFDATRELITAEINSSRPYFSRATWFFAVDRELHYPEPQFDAELHRAGDVYELVVQAKTLLRDVCLFTDRLDPDALVGEQLVTLLPGEKFPFVISSKRELSKEMLTEAKVLRCVNEFGAAT